MKMPRRPRNAPMLGSISRGQASFYPEGGLTVGPTTTRSRRYHWSMSTPSTIGIRNVEALHYYVRDLARTRKFLVEGLDFVELGVGSPELEHEGRQRSAAFAAGTPSSSSTSPSGRAGARRASSASTPTASARWSSRSRTSSARSRCSRSAAARRSTDIQRFTDDGGTLRQFSITTPFGDTTFRFIERRGYRPLFPGCVPHAAAARRQERVRLPAHRSRHLELPDHEAGAAVDGARAGLRAAAGRSQFHTSDVDPQRETRLGPEVGRDVGSGVRA